MLDYKQIAALAKDMGTPLYIFDLDELCGRIKQIQHILGEDINLCYAMKANPFLLDAMKKLSVKFEVCSPGEFEICEREKVDMGSIVLSGVNKEKADICHVMDDCGGVGMYTVESAAQFKLLAECASERAKTISVLLRVTSGNQFGLDEAALEELVAARAEYPFIDIKGIQCYTGTQKKKMQTIENELQWLDAICDRLKEKYDFAVQELEYGPGLPIHYFGKESGQNDFVLLETFAQLLAKLREKYKITLEMGRYIAATCGIYVSAVADTKTNQGQNYCIIDGGINHVNYYGQTMAMKVPAYAYVKADGTFVSSTAAAEETALEKWTICGSLCTVADVIVKNLPIGSPQPGDLLIFYHIGAYSVTEGIYLFLSRKMPKVTAYSKENGIEVYRDFCFSDRLNSRQELL